MRNNPKAVWMCKKIAKKYGLRLVRESKDVYLLYKGKKGNNIALICGRFQTHEYYYDFETDKMDDVTRFTFYCQGA